MIELIFLLIVLPRRMAELARERNRSALAWGFAASGAWIGAEIVVSVGITITAFISSAVFGWPKSPSTMTVLAYFPALAAGFLAGQLVKKRLESLPALEPKL